MAKTGPKPMDREPLLAHIFAEVAGGRSLDKVLREDDGMPSPSHFWRWHMEDEEIRDNLARARQNGVEVHLEECLSIADTPMMGEVVTEEDGEATKVVKSDMLAHRKLQIYTRLRRAEMIAPRKYGPKVDLTSNGEGLGLADMVAQARARLERGD